MPSPSRTEFLRSRLYRCALSFNRRNELRLKNIRDLLEKRDEKEKRKPKPGKRKKYISQWKLPDCDGKKLRSTQEDRAILTNTEKTDWVFDPEKSEYVLTINGVKVMIIPDVHIYKRLRPFQRDAVKWVAEVGPVGGILADDMGMGKTFMTICSLGARMACQRIKMVLIVAPVSVLSAWAAEGQMFLPKFAKQVRIVKVHGKNQQERQKIVRNAWKDATVDRPFVIISTWGLVASARTIKCFMPPSGHHWDYVILDEAHEIKNHKSNRSKCMARICRKSGTKRLCLTGTPFQNNTDELWSLVNMATAGQLLGKLKEFNKEYGKPIQASRNRSASSYDKKQGAKANEKLQDTLKPYMLRREKIDFLKDELPPKREFAVWVKPSTQQRKLYEEKVKEKGFLKENILSSNSEIAKTAKMGAFQLLAVLRNLCGHPLRELKGGPEGDIRSALEQTELKTVINGSRKVELVLHMLQGFKNDGHHTLIFSQSTQNLDVIQHVIMNQEAKLNFCRLDGSVSEKRRQDTVTCFQNGMFDVMLLSTGAGGVGLTLTRADRVIVFDPSWNPSQDNQAVDRSYRIGQKREVQVYRLFLAGSIEEKMYEKQVHKSGLEKTIFSEGNTGEARYFDKHELCKVFEQIPDGRCDLLHRFEKEGVAKVFDPHRYDLVRAHRAVIGISNHTSLYNRKRKGAFGDGSSSAGKRLKQTEGSLEETQGVVSDSEGSASELMPNATSIAVTSTSDNDEATQETMQEKVAAPSTSTAPSISN